MQWKEPAVITASGLAFTGWCSSPTQYLSTNNQDKFPPRIASRSRANVGKVFQCFSSCHRCRAWMMAGLEMPRTERRRDCSDGITLSPLQSVDRRSMHRHTHVRYGGRSANENIPLKLIWMKAMGESIKDAWQRVHTLGRRLRSILHQQQPQSPN